MTIRSVAIAAALVALTATSGLAATVQLNVVGGQLFGARNVDVNGALYDVEFVDGTCVALFNGCTSASDFAFSTRTLAVAAATSLMNTVFLDGPLGDFDSDPALTAGIEQNFLDVGFIAVPYEFRPGSLSAGTINFFNEPDDFDILSTLSSIKLTTDTSNIDYFVFARFTPSQITAVPLPAGGLLLLAGLAGLGLVQARRKTEEVR
ncbi:VPLPA-CTERM sorting domain-containing protein [uncultured Roseibium sp.]|uniref:VPLPA-CTERM sorting domain-containing protein n=1 Tax=uncultured Roseibium sp. TaxID=1936171 RepID=UPI00260C9091|nr:VPLPA-CTERM sorting domain-containing protein [uncultured Roseibium sp.]